MDTIVALLTLCFATLPVIMPYMVFALPVVVEILWAMWSLETPNPQPKTRKPPKL